LVLAVKFDERHLSAVTMKQFSKQLTIALLVVAAAAAASAAQSPANALRAEFLHVLDRPRVPLSPTTPRVAAEGAYTEEMLSYSAERDERVPVLIVKRAGQSERAPVVIVLHGTGGSKEGTRGQLRLLADNGFVAVAIDARFHGERARPIPGLANSYQSAMLRAFRTGVGHPYLYDTVWDVMRLIDYLVTRPDVDGARIGVVGNSKGGTEAVLAAAADPRIAVVVPWIGVQSFGWALQHSSAWEARVWTLRQAVEAAAADSQLSVNTAFVRKFFQRIAPGLVDTFDGPAMLPLIAPRPMLIVNGDSDPRSPLGGVRVCVAAAERAYAALGAVDRFRFLLEVDAAHEVTADAQAATLEWLTRWLAPSKRP
jgi:dienelactone hydrolase